MGQQSERVRARDGVPEDRIALEAAHVERLSRIESELREAVEEATRLGLDAHGLRHALDTVQDPRHAGMGQEKAERKRAALQALRRHMSASAFCESKAGLALLRTIEEN